MESYKISTITMSLQIPNCNLNLVNVGKYLEIDEDIMGIKYNFGEANVLKGKYLTAVYKKAKSKNENKINKKLFYNQISIIVKWNEHMINIKLFGNGSLHLTGIKDINESKNVMKLLYSKLLNLCKKNVKVLLTTDINGVYLDNMNNIYTRNKLNKSIIGYKHINENNEIIYNINKKEYIMDITLGLFVSKNFQTKRSKELLDLNGESVGKMYIELLKNKNKLYKNNKSINIDYNDGFVYYDSNGKSVIIGKIKYDITNLNKNENLNDDEKSKWIIEYEYNCNPFNMGSVLYCLDDLDKLSDEKLQIDINSINIYSKMDFQLNRQRLFNELIKRNYIVEYKPEKYSGVKLRFKVQKGCDKYVGVCECINKCTCTQVTFLIFQSGNIIVSGLKCIEEIKHIMNEFNKLIVSIESIIKIKSLS
jgi:TATA-box binding protein (TBP) (component of TFIID and TFIIIB)